MQLCRGQYELYVTTGQLTYILKVQKWQPHILQTLLDCVLDRDAYLRFKWPPPLLSLTITLIILDTLHKTVSIDSIHAQNGNQCSVACIHKPDCIIPYCLAPTVLELPTASFARSKILSSLPTSNPMAILCPKIRKRFGGGKETFQESNSNQTGQHHHDQERRSSFYASCSSISWWSLESKL